MVNLLFKVPNWDLKDVFCLRFQIGTLDIIYITFIIQTWSPNLGLQIFYCIENRNYLLIQGSRLEPWNQFSLFFCLRSQIATLKILILIWGLKL